MGTIVKVALGLVLGVWLLTHLFTAKVTVRPAEPAGAPVAHVRPLV